MYCIFAPKSPPILATSLRHVLAPTLFYINWTGAENVRIGLAGRPLVDLIAHSAVATLPRLHLSPMHGTVDKDHVVLEQHGRIRSVQTDASLYVAGAIGWRSRLIRTLYSTGILGHYKVLTCN